MELPKDLSAHYVKLTERDHYTRKSAAMEYSLNAFTELPEFSETNIKIKKENLRVGIQDLLCKRQTLYPSAT